MKITRLKIAGFKTFVEPADIVVEPGLTGVVGPNGCGKSNLVEALRWVMGESSFKNMRASGMDDVIFAGSGGGGAGGRPARNHAEVLLTLDNSERTAPAAFNDAERIDVTRRIDRGAGSTYRINGREVRARDVQLLFADAATGARSPAMVRQGQIAEIIAAKPQARRRILEDAAGIAGLHARRHEAELRLKSADDNLVRIDDVLREIDGQSESLRRQARQAGRYRALSADIRACETLLEALAWSRADAEAAAAETALTQATGGVADAAAVQARTATEQAVAARGVPERREAETSAAAALQRLVRARDALFAEERRAKERMTDLDRRLAELGRDLEREARLDADAAASLARLQEEAVRLAREEAAAGDGDALRAALDRTQTGLAAAEAALSTLQREVADLDARHALLRRTRGDDERRIARLESDEARTEGAREDAVRAGEAERAPLQTRADAAHHVLLEAERRQAETARTLQTARDTEAARRAPLREAEHAAERLEAERSTLAKLVAPPDGRRFVPVLDDMTVQSGFETALAAALGEDLEAALDADAPLRWTVVGGPDDPPLPEGAMPLADVVAAPPALMRRLRQIGIVAGGAGAGLAARLTPGQRLVSREGAIWRWDGFVAAAEAPSPTARRLAERNRLARLGPQVEAARAAAEDKRQAMEAAQAAVRQATAEEAKAGDAVRRAWQEADAAKEALARADREAAARQSRIAVLEDTQRRLAEELALARGALSATDAALAAFTDRGDLEARLAATRESVGAARDEAAQARLAAETHRRDREARHARLHANEREREAWQRRLAGTLATRADLAARREAAAAERQALAEAPDDLALRRRDLAGAIETAETQRRAAADALAVAETTLTQADRAARSALDALSAAREARAGAAARRDAAMEQRAAIARRIRETLGKDPSELLRETGSTERLGDAAAVEARLSDLKADRERMGAVNLRAQTELDEIAAKRGALAGERDDLTEAIRQLRGAIGNLNREGRERLLDAFGKVDAAFRDLFTTLFGGGTAELALVDSDDPLEAGLDIIARPPGKKPTTMTLLSGGEQALTATALIFAVFLTNPSPICVLDEVDAPLDDANVERYCDLLDDMARRTQTRFLVITHNPITMARMNRLFGVTMAERGVSTLVSVDLDEAERFREAG